jgi:hypothetical protein
MKKHKVNGVVCAYSGSYRKSGFYDTSMVLANPYRKLVKKSHMTHREHMGRISKIII